MTMETRRFGTVGIEMYEDTCLGSVRTERVKRCALRSARVRLIP